MSKCLADRLEAMLHQVGHPDYSLTEFYEGLKLIVWELRQRESALESVRSEADERIRIAELNALAARGAALEEAAKVCEGLIPKDAGTQFGQWRDEYDDYERCARRIRLRASENVHSTELRK